MNNPKYKKLILDLLKKEGRLPQTTIGKRLKIHSYLLKPLLKEMEEVDKTIVSEVNFSGAYKYYKLK